MYLLYVLKRRHEKVVGGVASGFMFFLRVDFKDPYFLVNMPIFFSGFFGFVALFFFMS